MSVCFIYNFSIKCAKRSGQNASRSWRCQCVAISEYRHLELFFAEPGIKVDGGCYRDVLLTQQMLQVVVGKIARQM